MGEHDAMLFGTPKTTAGKGKAVAGETRARQGSHAVHTPEDMLGAGSSVLLHYYLGQLDPE